MSIWAALYLEWKLTPLLVCEQRAQEEKATTGRGVLAVVCLERMEREVLKEINVPRRTHEGEIDF